MNFSSLTQVLAFAALAISVTLFAWRWRAMHHLPFGKDRSIPKDSAARGIVYSFTTGMAPWAKESTRRHPVAYLRGVVFHIGIFAALAFLIVSPWLESLNATVRIAGATLAGIGGILGVAGGILRFGERDLRQISTPDDHASVWLVSLVQIAAAVSLLWNSALPLFYLLATLMLLYAPVGKIRHCIYFYFARLFYGIHIGRRGIVRGLEEHHV